MQTKISRTTGGSVIVATSRRRALQWGHSRFPATHQLTRPGHRQISARVFLVAPEVPMGKSEPTVVVKAPGFSVRVDEVFEPWMQSLAEAGGRRIDVGTFDRILEVEVRINQRPRPIRVETTGNPIRPIEVKLPTATAIRREPVGRRPGRAGVSEIYLTRG